MNAGLVVIACAAASPREQGPVLRFAGVPNEIAPAGLSQARALAEARIKDHFAAWLYDWACAGGALDLATWEGGLSWWWFTPLSERSPLRSPLIARLNRLLVTRALLEKLPPGPLIWYDDAPVMRASVLALGRAMGRETRFVACETPLRGIAALALRRGLAAIADILRTAVLKLAGPDLRTMAPADVVITTRFPVQWEEQGGTCRERMVGKVPDVLAARGLRVGYAAATSGGPMTWLRNIGTWRKVMQAQAILPLRAHVAWLELLYVQFMPFFWPRYLRWRAQVRAKPVAFDGMDVSTLLWDEIDRMVLDPDIAGSRLMARGLARLVQQSPSVKYVLHPFEYQPLERGLWAGAKARPGVTVVGLQTAIATSGQLGFLPHAAELRSGDNADPRKAPLPDLLMCYGALSQSRFAEVIGARAVDGGALRYGALARLVDQPHDVAALRAKLDIPAGKTVVLVACPIDATESWLLVKGALALAAASAYVFLLFKFHYHTRLDDAVAPLADAAIPGRWRVFEAGLNDLILASDCVISGSTSVPYEALALNRPCLVYLPLAEWHTSKAADTPRAFLFWSSEAELTCAFQDLRAGASSLDAGACEDALRQQMRLVTNAEDALADRLAGGA